MSFFKRLFGIKDKEEQGSVPKPYVEEKKKSTSIDDLLKEEKVFQYEAPITHINKEATKETIAEEIKTAGNPDDWDIYNANGKEGFKDENGIIVIKANFDKVNYFENGLAIVQVNDKKGLINSRGEYVMKPEYSYIFSATEGLFAFEKEEMYGFANRDGTIAIKPQYFYAGGFYEGVSAVSEGGKDYYITKDNKKAFNVDFEDAGDFSEGLASAVPYDMKEGENKTGFIDRTGKFVIKPQFDFTGSFRNGFAPVCKNDQWAFIDKTGKPVCGYIYADAEDFYCGRAAVKQEKKGSWGYADTTGKLVIPCQFDYSSEFDEQKGSAYVFIKGKCYTLYPDGRKETV
ncbi:MAG: repeat protein [Bacteroidetes bacterium]|jgi:hypothetical protein|nr:repeat protein [Bacteroidota bacterium]